jgi:hypothetical protein
VRGAELFVEVEVAGQQPLLCRAELVGSCTLRLQSGCLELGVAGDEFAMTLFSADSRFEPALVRAQLSWMRSRAAEVRIVKAPPELRRLLARISTAARARPPASASRTAG